MHIFQGAHEFLPHLRLWPLGQSWPKCLQYEQAQQRERERGERERWPSNAAGGAVGKAEMHSIIYITQLCRAPNPSKQLSDPRKKAQLNKKQS